MPGENLDLNSLSRFPQKIQSINPTFDDSRASEWSGGILNLLNVVPSFGWNRKLTMRQSRCGKRWTGATLADPDESMILH